MYHILEVIEDGKKRTTIVPDEWLITTGSNKCFWPNCNADLSWVKHRRKPGPNWRVFNYKRIVKSTCKFFFVSVCVYSVCVCVNVLVCERDRQIFQLYSWSTVWSHSWFHHYYLILIHFMNNKCGDCSLCIIFWYFDSFIREKPGFAHEGSLQQWTEKQLPGWCCRWVQCKTETKITTKKDMVSLAIYNYPVSPGDTCPLKTFSLLSICNLPLHLSQVYWVIDLHGLTVTN